jgi:hypothetical protein
LAGWMALLMPPTRLLRSAIVLKPSTLLAFHKALSKRKYRNLFSPNRLRKPGPKGPSAELIHAVVEMKQRNPNWRHEPTKRSAPLVFWGCQMAVEMITDHWNPSKRHYRTETLCCGPRCCPLYRSGPARKVPGRHGMSYAEEDWVDDEATSRRGPDD